MNGDVYTKIAEELKRLGGIDEIGVVSAAGQSAIIYAGNKEIKKYYDGSKIQSVIFSVSAMDTNNRQAVLVEKLCGICETLAASKPVIEGISQVKVKVNSLPAPTMNSTGYTPPVSKLHFLYRSERNDFMTLKEMFAKVKTNPAFVGFITTDQMVLAIDVSAEQNADVDEFAVAYMGFTDRSSSLNPKEKTNSYYYHGESSTKTGNQRTITFKCDRYKGDPFQDFVTSFDMKYAKGQAAIVRYAWFNILTGEGEIGSGSLILDDDGSGAPEENLSVGGSIKKAAAEPTKLEYMGFGGYTALKVSPADWASKYDSYYERKNGAFVKLEKGESAPEFAADKYYSKAAE